MKNTLVFATNNKHKLMEIRKIIPPGFEILSLEDIACFEDIPETTETLEGNASLKSGYAYLHYQKDCFADDTGLEVDALGGKPGVHSSADKTVVFCKERIKELWLSNTQPFD